LENTVTEEAIDEALHDIQQRYMDGNALVQTREFGNPQVVRIAERHKHIRHKFLDGYAASEKIRKVIMSRQVVRFLNIIFDRPAMAFQGLYFETGSQQVLHQDSAYVRLNRPMELAASWLAMEDIKPESGELEYYVGSHRIKEYIFQGNSKWLPFNSDENPIFHRYVEEECKRSNLKRARFLPKKGDALIWHADLVHGGSKITQSATRRSFVTHWCPSTSEPSYFHYPPHSGKVKVSDTSYYCYSFHGHPADPYLNMAGEIPKTRV